MAVVRARVQLIQRDRCDGRPIHGERIAGVAGEVREGVGSHHGAHVHLRIILLTAVILQVVDKEETKEKRGSARGVGGLVLTVF